MGLCILYRFRRSYWYVAAAINDIRPMVKELRILILLLFSNHSCWNNGMYQHVIMLKNKLLRGLNNFEQVEVMSQPLFKKVAFIGLSGRVWRVLFLQKNWRQQFYTLTENFRRCKITWLNTISDPVEAVKGADLVVLALVLHKKCSSKLNRICQKLRWRG